MITGDNIYTALYVAIKTRIVEENQSIWVGMYKKRTGTIEWSYFTNNEYDNFKKDSLTDETHSQIFKSHISRQNSFPLKEIDDVMEAINK